MTCTIGRLFLQMRETQRILWDILACRNMIPNFTHYMLGRTFEHLLASLSFGHVKEVKVREQKDLKVGTAQEPLASRHRSFKVLAQVKSMTWFLQADFEDTHTQISTSDAIGEQPPVCKGLKALRAPGPHD